MTVILAALAFLLPAHQNQDYRWSIVRPYNVKLIRMAICESHPGGARPRWFLNTGNGFYGGLQFKLSTWKSLGGRGYPHRNSVLEQKYRAVREIKRNGYGAWPHCRYA